MPRCKSSWHAVLSSPVGHLGVVTDRDKLSRVHFLLGRAKTWMPEAPFVHKISQQLAEYFTNPRTVFSVPLDVIGTDFQKKIWSALQKIPVGETITYGALAKTLHTSPRAIGNACRSNPIPIMIPCHRVVAQKTCGGFVGKTQGKFLAVKQWLLDHEAVG